MAGEGSSTQAAATKVKLPCPADNCNETRASKQTLGRHIVKAHQGVQQGVQQFKNFLLSPMTSLSSSPGPPRPASASSASSASSAPSATPLPTTTPTRQLFSGGVESQVHEQESEDNVDEEEGTGDGDAAEEEEEEEEGNLAEEEEEDDDLWLYEALDKYTHEVIEADEEDRQELKGKINEVTQKLQTKALHTKHMINKLREEKAQWRESLVNQRRLEDENQRLRSSCDGCSNSEEVIEQKNNSLDIKEAEIAQIGKKIKKLETENKKIKADYKTDIDTVHDTLANIAKRNNDLKAEVEKKNKLIEALEASKAAESDHVNDVEVHIQEEDERVVMSQSSRGHACNACDKVFNAAIDLERHMNDKHLQRECQMCKAEFTTKKQAEEHICTEPEIILQKCDKSYCQKEFASSEALRVHIKKTHFGSKRTVCTKCDEILNTKDVRKHMDICGKNVPSIERTQEKSMEVCRHWR